MIPVLILFVPYVLRGETGMITAEQHHTAGREVLQQDTSGVVVIRIYRDSVKNERGAYLPLEARVVEGKIISVFVDGKEVSPDDPSLSDRSLTALLQREKELKQELSQLMNEISDREKELDSLTNAPFRVSEHLFFPGGDLHEQVMTAIEEDRAVQVPPADSLPTAPVMPQEGRIDSLMAVLLNLSALRDENAGMLKEELEMLRKQKEEVMEQLERIDERFDHEEVVIRDHKKKKKGKIRKRRKKTKKNGS